MTICMHGEKFIWIKSVLVNFDFRDDSCDVKGVEFIWNMDKDG